MKISGQCPCGYFFDTFEDAKAAIVEVKEHFERFHENLLPFGITDAEALSLLKKGKTHRQQNVSTGNYLSTKQNVPMAQEII
jgi:hypothetical protein